MYEFKLQVACMVVILSLIVVYIKGTLDKRIRCNPIYDALMYVAPAAVFFDGLTAWTVNHPYIVPEWINQILHCLFFLSMAVVVLITFLYVLYQTMGLPSKRWLFLECIPAIATIAGILLTMKDLYYVHGRTSYYSMGMPVYICYASLSLHFTAGFILICVKFKTLKKDKVLGIMSFNILILAVMITQLLIPEALISALLPTIAIVGIYVNFEDPFSRRLELYNANLVSSFATLVENRDDNTGGHIRRTRGYVEIILNQMKKYPRYRKVLTKDYISNVLNAAPMHDIGKIGTPDQILQKPGKLTPEEYEIMKQHSVRGGEIIKSTFANLEEPEYQKIAYEVARHHHEKWNGKGYPDGLKEKHIPLHARIMAIADVFDAVSAKRCYRDAMPLETCFKIIEDGIGVDFDPFLARLFLNAKKEILDYIEEDKEQELYLKWQKD